MLFLFHYYNDIKDYVLSACTILSSEEAREYRKALKKGKPYLYKPNNIVSRNTCFGKGSIKNRVKLRLNSGGLD